MNQPFCNSLPFIADKVHTTITINQIIGKAIYIENNLSFNFSNLQELKFSIQKDFDMRIDLSNKSVDIPNHPPKIIFNNCIHNKPSFNLRSDLQQTLEQTFDQNLQIC